MGPETAVRWSGPYAGKKTTARHRQMILARERILKWNEFATTIVQGSFNFGVAASAGTHDGGNCVDYTTYADRLKEKFGRILGEAYFRRLRSQGFSMDHGHGVLDYGGSTAQIAKNQTVSYHGRGNGLRGNGRDTGYQMLVFPKFIYNGYVGYVEATKACGAYEQPTSKSKLLTKVAKGQTTFVVAEVEVAGTRWYVTLTGKCIKRSNTKRIAQPIKKQRIKQTYRVKKGPAYGRIAPGLKAIKKGKSYVRPVGFKFDAVYRYKHADGWFVETAHGTWYAEVSLEKYVAPPPSSPKPTTPPAPTKPTPAPPPPAAPTALTVRAGTRNVIRWRMGLSERSKAVKNWKPGKKYADRAKLIADDAKAVRLDFLGTQEQGQYKDGDLLADHLGRYFDSVLHGDDAGDITQANIFNTDTLPMLRSGKFKVSGTSHCYVTWTEHNLGRDQIAFVNLHCWWKPAGKSTRGNKEDHLREDQVREAIAQAEKVIGPKAIIVFLGDFNSAKNNPYDGPGKAAVSKGYVDAENYAKKKVNEKRNSYMGDDAPSDSRQIDRFFVKKKHLDSGRLVILEWGVTYNVKTKAGSDHLQVYVVLSVINK